MRNATYISRSKLVIPVFCFASQLTFAQSWTGVLVDAKCFQTAQPSYSESDSPATKDANLEIRLCSPKAKTRLFAVVPRNGDAVVLDTAGNAKAAELVHQRTSKGPVFVTVNGEKNNNKVLALELTSPSN